MRYYWLLLFMGLSWGLTAQDETAAVADEEIFKVVDEMPRFPGCDEETGLSKEELNQCAQKQMLEFI